MHSNLAYQVICLKYDPEGKLTMMLSNDDVLNLELGLAKWYESTTLVHSSGFHIDTIQQQL